MVNDKTDLIHSFRIKQEMMRSPFILVLATIFYSSIKDFVDNIFQMFSASSLIRANEGDYEENQKTVFDHKLMSIDHKLRMKYIHPTSYILAFFFFFFFPLSHFSGILFTTSTHLL